MKKILVVKNDVETMVLLRDLLEKRTYQVIVTSDGRGSVQLARKLEPDIILVDLLQQAHIHDLKNDPDTSRIPVILMTGYTLNSQSLADTEADDIIQKPFYIAQLEEKINNQLNALAR